MKCTVRTSDGKAMYPAPNIRSQSSYHRSFGCYWWPCEVRKEVVMRLHINKMQSQLCKVAALVPKSLRGSGGSATADRLALDALDALDALLISSVLISNTVRFQSCSP